MFKPASIAFMYSTSDILNFLLYCYAVLCVLFSTSGPQTFWMPARHPNSRSYQRPRAGLLCVLKKTTRAPSLTFVYRYCYLFYLLRNIFAMWLMKLILLLHN